MSWDEAKHPRDRTGKWSILADAILKTASDLRDKAGVSHEGHTRYTKQAASELETAAHKITTGDHAAAGKHLQAARDALKQGHPRHRKLAAIDSHIGAHKSFSPPGPYVPGYWEKQAGRAGEPPAGARRHQHALFVSRTRELLEQAGLA